MQTTHTPHFNQSDSRETRDTEQNKVGKEPAASTAIVIIVVAALAIAVVWFASAYYSAHYKNNGADEGMVSNTNNAPSTATPENSANSSNQTNSYMNASPNAGAGGNTPNPDTNTNPNASQ